MALAVQEDLSMADLDTDEETIAGTAAVTPPFGIPMIDTGKIIAEVSKRVTEEIASQFIGGGGGGGGEPPSKKFLGSDARSWVGWFAKGAIVVAAFLFAWYNTVNKELESKPSFSQARQMMSKGLDDHESRGNHPHLEALVEANTRTLKSLSDIQIRQTAIMESQTRSLDAVERKVERIRSPRRR